MAKRKNIPQKLGKKIFQEANSKCPFCNESDIECLEIHHIYPVSKGGGSEPENLILTCSNCHSLITYGEIKTSQVIKKKYELMTEGKASNESNRKAANIIEFHKTSNSGIIANNLTYKSNAKSAPKVLPPIGSIGSDLNKRNYVKYLIDRYNEFKKADKHLDNFKYAIIYKAIQKNFKAKWDMVPLEKFDELVNYLQNRIDKTIVGKANKSKNQKSYSTHHEFVNKLLS